MKIAIAQLNYKIGDFVGNYAKIEQAVLEKKSKVEMVAFTELCLSGYFPRDLILNDKFMEMQDVYFDKVKKLSKSAKTPIMIGYIERNLQKQVNVSLTHLQYSVKASKFSTIANNCCLLITSLMRSVILKKVVLISRWSLT